MYLPYPLLAPISMRVIERIIVCFHPSAPRTLDLSTKYALHVIDHIPLPLSTPPLTLVSIMHSFPYAQPGTACTFSAYIHSIPNQFAAIVI